MEQLETQIARWRTFVARDPVVDGHDVEELEAHLRDQIADLDGAGLAADEAFLVAVKRMGRLDELSHEFAREHSGRLWRQLVLGGDDDAVTTDRVWVGALAFAVAAAVTVQVARLVAGFPAEEPTWLLRSGSLFVLPFLAGYLSWRRRLSLRRGLATAAPFAVAAVLVNAFPYQPNSSTEVLVAAHLPVALWFVLAYPYAAGVLGCHERRMDFVRFTGEWCIYYVLIALGGGVLVGLTALILEPTGAANAERVIEWVLPSGAAGAAVVAAWLVESKQRVVENMAPVLTALFTPLFAVMLVCAVVVYAATGLGSAFDRELLAVFDGLLVVVLGLVLYGISARDPSRAPGWMDRTQLVAVVGALSLDVMVLGAMATRIGELGFTPNRTVALGLNLVLLVNLVGAAWRSLRFVLGRGSFHALERWQTSYLPVLFAWVVTVVVILPPLFAFS